MDVIFNEEDAEYDDEHEDEYDDDYDDYNDGSEIEFVSGPSLDIILFFVYDKINGKKFVTVKKEENDEIYSMEI